MRKFVIYSFLSCLAGMPAGCIATKEANTYAFPVFERTDSVKWETVNDDLIVGMVADMAIGDSTIYILSPAGGTWLHLYNRFTGKEQGNYIYMGEGPGEVINAASMHVDEKAGTIELFDAATSNLHTYATNFANGTITVTDTKNMMQFLPVTRQCIIVPGGKAVLEGSAGDTPLNRHLYLLNGTRITAQCDSMAVLPEQSMIYLQNPGFSISPDGTHMATSTLFGGIIETFSIGDNTLTPDAIGRFFDPGISLTPDNRINTDNALFGFSTLATTDKYIFGAFSGTKDANDFHRIGIWNWKLNPRRLLLTDKIILSMAVSPNNDNEIYAITVAPGHDFALKKLVIP